MFQSPPRGPEGRSWALLAGWTLVIYLTAPLARSVQRLVSGSLGRGAFTLLVLAAIATALFLAARSLREASAAERLSRGAWLAAVAAVAAAWTLRLYGYAPEEAVHFLEYGVLGGLAFRALAHRVRDWGIYPAAGLVGSLAGTGDEVLQWLTPGRHFAFGDIGLNAGAGALMQVALAGGIRPAFLAPGISAGSARLAVRLAGAHLLALGLCASNTPERIAWYAARVPGLGHLLREGGVMVEYGHRIRDPEIGTFYSRFPPEVLRRLDAERAQEAAAILDAYAGEERYPAFLRDYSAIRDPFVHEARVHLFRRDRFRRVLEKHRGDPVQERFHQDVAHRENRILEKYFPRTLGASSYALSALERQELADGADPFSHYRSRVGEHLLVRFTERGIWSGIVLLGILLAAADRGLARGGRILPRNG
jgi:hypothetical protein